MYSFESLEFKNNFSIELKDQLSVEVDQYIEHSEPLAEGSYKLTLSDSNRSVFEIVTADYASAWPDISGAAGFFVTGRGEEGTVARSWPAGSTLYASVTAGMLEDIRSDLSYIYDKLNEPSGALFAGQVQIEFEFAVPRNSHIDKITAIGIKQGIGYTATYIPLNETETMYSRMSYDGIDSITVNGSDVTRGRVVLPASSSRPINQYVPQYMSISVTGGSNPAEFEVKIRITKDGLLLGEKTVMWPISLEQKEYEIEYEFW